MLFASGFSQVNPNRFNLSPYGVLDNVLDQFGKSYRLQDLLIKTTSNSSEALNRSVLINCVTTSYFNLYFEDGSGMETVTDPVQNAINTLRRTTVCQVFQDLSAFINSPLTTSGNKVNIWIRNINNLQLPSTNGLLGTGSGFYNLPSSSSISGIADNELWKTIHSGVDSYANVSAPLVTTGTSSNASGVFYHGYLAINFNTTNSSAIVWNTNTTVANTSGSYDLYSVVLHEIMHALGFNTLINQNGLSGFNSPNYKYFSRYDQFLKSNNNISLLRNATNSTLFNNDFNSSNLSPNILRPGCTQIGNVNSGPGIDNTVCNTAIKFVGSTNTVPVYTPICYENGSSLSHFEDEHYPTCNSTLYGGDNNYFLMCNSGGTGVTRRFLKPEERDALCDIGYNTNNTFGVSGAKINGTSISYSYGGSATCKGIVVSGTNDGINLDNSYTFVVDLNTNLTLNSLQLLSNDKNATGIEAIEDVSTFPPLTTVIPNSVLTFSGTVINFKSGNSGLHLLRYVPTALVNGILQRGNITYVYIYVKEVIISCPAIPNTCDLIINGDFEKNEPYIPGFEDNINLNCGWVTACPSPDRFRTLAPDAPLQIPCNFHGFQFDSLVSLGNKSYVGLGNAKFGSVNWHELIKTKLKVPLIAGVTYQLSFNSSLGESWSGSSIRLQACVSSDDYFLATETLDFNIPSGQILTSTVQSDNTEGWTTNVINFVAVGGEQFLYLGGLQLQNPFTIITPKNPFPNCTATRPSTTNDLTTYNYLDNVSLVPVNGSFSLPTTITCGSNFIANLNQLVDGVPLNGVFTGLGVQVSPLGIYSFNTAISGIGNIAITYSYTSSGCPKSIIRTINVFGPSVTPTFNSIPVICRGASFVLPILSANGISGTWSPVFDNQASRTYTFTPNANTCGIQTTLTVTISNTLAVIPTFNVIPAICYGATLNLPTTSNNGFTGIWTPTINNTQTTNYTFTPNNGLCANTITMQVVVNPPTISISGASYTCVGNAYFYTGSVTGGTWSLSNPSIGNIDNLGFLIATNTGATNIIYTITTGTCIITTTLQITVFDQNILPVFSFPTTICIGAVPPILSNISDNGIPGYWIPAVIDNSLSGTYLFKPVNNCSPIRTFSITVISEGALVANNDIFNIPLPIIAQPSSNFLLNDSYNANLLTSNYLGLTIIIINPINGITFNQNGTLNLQPDLESGVYTINYQLRNDCLNSNIGTITITIGNLTIVSPKRTSNSICFNPIAYTTSQNVLQNVTINGIPVKPFEVDITNIVAPAGFSLNAGNINVPAGALSGSYVFTYKICPAGLSSGCLNDIIFVLQIATTLRANPDVFIFGVSGNFAVSNNSLNNKSIITNDFYSQDCALNTPNSFGQAVLGTNVTLQSANFVPTTNKFVFDLSNGNVNSLLNQQIPTGSYPFKYTICDKLNPTICVNNNGWVSVISNARSFNQNNLNIENIKIIEIEVLPNPSKGMFNLVFNEIINEEIFIEIYNILGQKLIEHKINRVSEYLLDLYDLPNATYLLKVRKNEFETNKLIIKQ